MKKLLLAVSLMALCSTGFGADKEGKNALLASDTLVWAGLDYSQVRMIGAGDFRDSSAIFPDMLEAWNRLFLAERIKFVEKETKKRVVTDIEGVKARNLTAKASQIIESPGPEDTIEKSHLTEQDIAKAVKSYKLENKSGLGAVFIVDRLIKQDKNGEGAVYVVAFDIATRQVLFSERKVSRAAGFGFRNYWFRVIKDAEPALKKCR